MVGGIGNLLAQIEGDKPSPGSARPAPRLNPLPKRRADDQLRREPAKTMRTGPTSRPTDRVASSPAIPTRQPPRPSERPCPSRTTPSRPHPPHRSNGAALGSRPSAAGGSTRPPAPATPPAPASTQKPPKKGSFAEIMARGQRAQATMGQVGKIQHKRLEKPQVKKDDPEAADPRSRAAKKPGAAPRSATKGSRAPAAARARRPSPEPEPKKKVRRPPATTGYAGTARPRPGGAAPSRPSSSAKPAPGGVLLNPQFGRASRARDEDEDSMDGFITDDEEGDEYGGRPGGARGGARAGYDSGDESSDMEAGLDEIDDEEAMAAAIARRDDQREERLERERKLEKERRRREAMRR